MRLLSHWSQDTNMMPTYVTAIQTDQFLLAVENTFTHSFNF